MQENELNDIILNFNKDLEDDTTSLAQKYRILFSLRNLKCKPSLKAMINGLNDKSNLFRHDICFCLGQRQDIDAIPILSKILSNKNEHAMVRHEAGEALGAIGTSKCIPILEAYKNDLCQEVSETCTLALDRIKHYNENKLKYQSRFKSVDPAAIADTNRNVLDLQNDLLNENVSMFQRYGALFALREIGNKEAVIAISKAFECNSALLKHEIAYVFGQLQSPESISALINVLSNKNEHSMVRHEAAEALGSIGGDICMETLKKFKNDLDPIVADSCIVALDMLAYEASGDFQYAAMS